jgi:transposase
MSTKEKKRMRGRPSVFTPEQKQVLLRYYEEKDMKSTHKRNSELMERAAEEGNIPLDRVKVT